MVCTLDAFTACSKDDDDKPEVTASPLIGTWNVQETVVKEEDLYDGSVKINWEGTANTGISLGEGFTLPMSTVIPMAANMANTYLPQVLKSVTFNEDGTITALYKEADDGLTNMAQSGWKVAAGYANYQIVNDDLIHVYLTNKVWENADEETLAIVSQFQSTLNADIPVHLHWNTDKSKFFFYVDKDNISPILTTLSQIIIANVPTSGMNEDDLATFQMLKAIATQVPDILNATTTFEAGLELEKISSL